MTLRLFFASVVALAVCAVGSRANPADRAPRPPWEVELGQKEAQLVILVDDRIKQARLIIPQSLVGKRPQRDVGLRLPPASIGVILTLALVGGSLCFIRQGRGRHAGALLVLGLVLASGCGPQGSEAPNQTGTRTDPKEGANYPMLKLPAGVTLSGDLLLEISPAEAGNDATLHVNRSMVRSIE